MSNNNNSNGNHNNSNGNHNNSNGNHNNIPDSTTNLVESSELGEVKTALGRLYKEFESFKQSQKTERERDRAELQAWAQTNLIQNQLLSKAIVTIEMLTGELKTQNLSCQEYELNNADLMQQLTLLLGQSQSTQKSSPTLESLEFKGLKSEVSDLKKSWSELVNHTKMLTTVIRELKNTPPPKAKPITIEKEVFRSEPQSKSFVVASMTALTGLILFFFINQVIPVKISDDIHNYLQDIWRRTDWTNTKVERVERYLGTDSKRRK